MPPVDVSCCTNGLSGPDDELHYCVSVVLTSASRDNVYVAYFNYVEKRDVCN